MVQMFFEIIEWIFRVVSSVLFFYVAIKLFFAMSHKKDENQSSRNLGLSLAWCAAWAAAAQLAMLVLSPSEYYLCAIFNLAGVIPLAFVLKYDN